MGGFSKLTKLDYNTLQHSANMSVFDILGAIATMIQFVEYGVSFSNKAIAIHKNRGELPDLLKSIREYQRLNNEFQKCLHLRAPNPTSPEGGRRRAGRQADYDQPNR